MKKLILLGAGAVGYVLGAKAGRERYDQIAEQAQRLRNNPTVQQKVDEAKHVAKDAAEQASEKVRSQTRGSADEAPATTSFGQGDEGGGGGI